MKKWAVGAIWVLGAVVSHASVVVSDDFTIGNNDNVNGAVIAGTVTDTGGVTWRSNASGNWRFNGTAGGAVNQNNAVDSDPRLYLDYASIMDVGNTTTLSLKAQVVDADAMFFGFGKDDNVMSGGALNTAFWTRIQSNGIVDMWVRDGAGVNTKIFNGLQVKATGDDILDISLTYDRANNQVWGSVAGGAATATLGVTALGFTPTFDQFNFELLNEGGTRANAGYFDDVQIDVIPEPMTFGLLGMFGVATMFIRRYFVI